MSSEKTRPCVPNDEPNAETIEALRESREAKLESYATLDDFWKATGIDPEDQTYCRLLPSKNWECRPEGMR